LSVQQLDQFAREDPKVRRHIEVVRKKELLERVLKEMEALRALETAEGRRRRTSSSKGDIDGDGRRNWRMF